MAEEVSFECAATEDASLILFQSLSHERLVANSVAAFRLLKLFELDNKLLFDALVMQVKYLDQAASCNRSQRGLRSEIYENARRFAQEHVDNGLTQINWPGAREAGPATLAEIHVLKEALKPK